MFGSIYNFLYKHRHKLYFGSGIIGGLVFLSHVTKSKILHWHDKKTLIMIDKQKRKQHYEKTRQTANATVLSLSSSISKIVSEELNMDSFLQTIRNHPSSKRMMWEELKVLGFTRCIVSIYTSALVCSVVHAHLMLLGGYTYRELMISGHVRQRGISSNVQENYLSCIQTFIEDGLPNLIAKILKVVNESVRPISLNELMSLEQLEEILRAITLKLSEVPQKCDETKISFKLTPWSQYVHDFKSSNLEEIEKVIFKNMTEAMLDILNTDDFDIVIESLINLGLNHVLDYMVDFYPHPQMHQELNSDNIAYHKSADESTSHKSTNECVNQKSTDECYDFSPQSTKLGTETLNLHNEADMLAMKEVNAKLISSSVHFPIVKSKLPLPKLIPVLSDVIYHVLSPAPGHLLQSLLLNEKLENLCFNIYEAFSVGI